ncbi:hypothetical protein EYZ11_008126 [Aspergillus tanneri]|uniref:Uncharacterized protein n=1 Tax=Aspergillus tanneri TaxID=1220188 RepID=A0A4S3JBB7_9EURO|nr:hypothetical protein EYZ11_008126 [Aspergillus tanneri]
MTTNPVVQKAVDLQRWPHAKLLVHTCNQFLQEIRDLTPGPELEARLNREYGPGHPYYEDMCKLVKLGLEEGWVASEPLDGPKYRRSRVATPGPENNYMSITTVFFDTNDAGRVPVGPVPLLVLINAL